MWLLNVNTLQLEAFIGYQIPEYAILSHTWGLEEVTFEDMKSQRGADKAGYEKITGCCTQAIKDGYTYCWVDTCCIDKSSSAELSEAINSMFLWYERSSICYVYLSDVPSWSRPGWNLADQKNPHDAFKRSRWFTRGWTLQELLAPSELIFYAKNWSEIDTKMNLLTTLETITGIPSPALSAFRRLSKYNVATRMSWAAGRQTTREEDVAYCLFGIFDINLPLLYGEGPKAFLRLQEEILRTIEDASLFAWSDISSGSSDPCGFLAPSPSCFGYFRLPELFEVDLKQKRFDLLDVTPPNVENDPPWFTSRGIKITLHYEQQSWGASGGSDFRSQPASHANSVLSGRLESRSVGGGALVLHCYLGGQRFQSAAVLNLTIRVVRSTRSPMYLRCTRGPDALAWEKPPLEYIYKTMYLQPSSLSSNEDALVPSNFALATRFSKHVSFGTKTTPHWHIEKEWGQIAEGWASLRDVIRGYDHVLVGHRRQTTALLINYLPGDCYILLKLTFMAPFCFCQLKQVQYWEREGTHDPRFFTEGFKENLRSEDTFSFNFSTMYDQNQTKIIRAITRRISDNRFRGNVILAFELDLSAF